MAAVVGVFSIIQLECKQVFIRSPSG